MAFIMLSTVIGLLHRGKKCEGIFKGSCPYLSEFWPCDG
jgi:hypothetical protein